MKAKQYRLLREQIRALIEGETDKIAVMANVCAAIHEAMGFWWTGFYLVKGEDLVLGPFQGPVACMHIGYGKGVCGTAWKEQQTIIVPDVEQFPGHIACSSLSRSEIVVPVFSQNGSVSAVLDIDSKELDAFDRVVFENIVEKIIFGGYDSTGKPAPFKLTFVLRNQQSITQNYDRERYKEKQKEMRLRKLR